MGAGIARADVGGIAGGEKFFSKGVFFKFVTDDQGLYGGLDRAARAAEHELDGIRAIFDAHVAGVHVPLMMIIDHLGYRLIATSRLPLGGSETLIYGSDDQGRTVMV